MKPCRSVPSEKSRWAAVVLHMLMHLQEECGLVVDETALEERGEIAIVRATVSSTVVAIIHLYTVSQWTGVLVE